MLSSRFSPELLINLLLNICLLFGRHLGIEQCIFAKLLSIRFRIEKKRQTDTGKQCCANSQPLDVHIEPHTLSAEKTPAT